jgi:hypothetical protein
VPDIEKVILASPLPAAEAVKGFEVSLKLAHAETVAVGVIPLIATRTLA